MNKEHSFSDEIANIIKTEFKRNCDSIYSQSLLLQYIDKKTKSANKGSKSRGSFANLYAIYVLVEDYLHLTNEIKENYSDYKGADFSKLLENIRKLPFGERLQNHALNSRLNDEFHKFFPNYDGRPIIRDVEQQKYWINENLLKIKIDNKIYNIAKIIILIILKYIDVKQESFNNFIEDCKKIQKYSNNQDTQMIFDFIKNLIQPEKDARIFEIVSYAILKYIYSEEIIFIGAKKSSVTKENLKLYKTGRTNANDGGIDFVMKPLGRFFQVTETLDVKKYFLDIGKVEHYPITFVIKTKLDKNDVLIKLKNGAKEQYTIKTIVAKYMNSIEEIITINELLEKLNILSEKKLLNNVIEEIIIWSKLEFNYVEDNETVIDNDEDEDVY